MDHQQEAWKLKGLFDPHNSVERATKLVRKALKNMEPVDAALVFYRLAPELDDEDRESLIMCLEGVLT